MKTTKADFKLFKKEATKWIKFFGLLDWDVDFQHDSCNGAFGECSGNYSSKHAIITMATDVEKCFHTKDQIKLVAFHEVIELMLMELRIVANEGIGQREVDRSIHCIIQRLVNSIFKGGL